MTVFRTKLIIPSALRSALELLIINVLCRLPGLGIEASLSSRESHLSLAISLRLGGGCGHLAAAAGADPIYAWSLGHALITTALRLRDIFQGQHGRWAGLHSKQMKLIAVDRKPLRL